MKNQPTILCWREGTLFVIEVTRGDVVSLHRTYRCRDTFRAGLDFVKFCYPTARIGVRRP